MNAIYSSMVFMLDSQARRPQIYFKFVEFTRADRNLTELPDESSGSPPLSSRSVILPRPRSLYSTFQRDRLLTFTRKRA